MTTMGFRFGPYGLSFEHSHPGTNAGVAMFGGGRVERREVVSADWPLLIASCRECRRLQHLVADRFQVTEDGLRHRCRFCDVPFAVRHADAVALGVDVSPRSDHIHRCA
jgi:hypothetical protein